MSKHKKYTTLDEYIRQGEPTQKRKAENWSVAIGLQQVDGLTPSAYLLETAKANIENEITIDEAKARINSYYQAKPCCDEDDRTDEADKVATEIAKILAEQTFSFTPLAYLNIHKRLFAGIYKHAGKIRDYNIRKEEWVLRGESVYYASALDLRETLEYEFNCEKQFCYEGLTKAQTIEHIARFIVDLWQIHVFGEGNTRTAAVFLIKYLRKLGFTHVTNQWFADHSWYFRNALVRANYENIAKGIHCTLAYLLRFLGNLLNGETNPLKNRDLLIEPVKTTSDTVNDTVKLDYDTAKESKDMVLSLMKSNPAITAQQIADSLGFSLSTAKRRIKALKNSKAIERVGSDKCGYWQIQHNSFKKINSKLKSNNNYEKK